jgi:hypothetical protein
MTEEQMEIIRSMVKAFRTIESICPQDVGLDDDCFNNGCANCWEAAVEGFELA